MKTILPLFLILLGFSLSAQSIDSLGKTDDPVLTDLEAEYLNTQLKGQRKTFDFKDKKLVYITGTTALYFLTKGEYFKEVKKKKSTKAGISQALILFTEKETIDSGYDALIAVAMPPVTDRQRKDIDK